MPNERFVKKWTRVLFGFIVAVMVVSLVVSFGSGGTGGCQSGGRGDREAGQIFGRKVTESEWNIAHRQALALHHWNFLHSGPFGGNPGFFLQYIMRQENFRWPQQPKAEDLDRLAWEGLCLRHYATLSGLSVSPEEVQSKILQLASGAGLRTTPWDEDQYQVFVGRIFETDVQTFEAMVPGAMLADKLLAFSVDGPSADYKTLVDRVLKDERMFRVQVAQLDPEEFFKEIRQPSPEEIQKHYDANKNRFQVPEKYQLEFLLADVEKLTDKQPQPADAEVEKYYNDNKAIWIKTPAHTPDDGHGHGDHEPLQAAEYKPLAEVRDDVIKRVRRSKAEKQAYETMLKVNAKLGDKWTALRKAKTEEVAADKEWKEKSEQDRSLEARKRAGQASGTIFNDLLKDFEGAELKNDITLRFSAKQGEEVEKLAGKPTDSFNPAEFAKSNQVGTFSPLVKTDKGAAIFRLNVKEESYVPDLTEPVKLQIIRELAKEKLKGRSGKAAQELVTQINATPANRMQVFRQLRESRPELFKQTVWFKSNVSSDLGTGEFSVGNAVKDAVNGAPDPQAGFAIKIEGEKVGGEKRDWGFLAVIEDVVNLLPEDIEKRLKDEKKEMEDGAKQQRRDQRVKEIVGLANKIDKTKELKNRPADDDSN